jgi:hypothetical protein
MRTRLSELDRDQSARRGSHFLSVLCSCGHQDAVPVAEVLAKHGDITVYEARFQIRCSRCGSSNVFAMWMQVKARFCRLSSGPLAAAEAGRQRHRMSSTLLSALDRHHLSVECTCGHHQFVAVAELVAKHGDQPLDAIWPLPQALMSAGILPCEPRRPGSPPGGGGGAPRGR